MNRRNRSRTKAVLSSPVTLVIALALLAFMARAAVRIHAQAAESAQRLAEAQASLAKIQANATALQGQIGELSTPEGVEASMREQYHAVEPGESVAVIVDPDASGQQDSQPAATTTPSQSWWQRIFGF